MSYYDGHGNNRTAYVHELEKKAVQATVNVSVDLSQVKELQEKLQKLEEQAKAYEERAVSAEAKVIELMAEISKLKKRAKKEAL